jgi:hypothetical protein
MKNIHILPTDKPSRLTKNNLGKLIKLRGLQHQEVNENQYIYITSDEEIKDGEYGLSRLGEIIKFHSGYDYRYYAKIILTTDQDLIKDGVQAIDDEFLEWFIYNSSCEYVKTIFLPQNDYQKPYVISIDMKTKDGKKVIPQEEWISPMQKFTLKEETKQPILYTEEEVRSWLIHRDVYLYNYYTTYKNKDIPLQSVDDFIEENHEYLMNREK